MTLKNARNLRPFDLPLVFELGYKSIESNYITWAGTGFGFVHRILMDETFDREKYGAYEQNHIYVPDADVNHIGEKDLTVPGESYKLTPKPTEDCFCWYLVTATHVFEHVAKHSDRVLLRLNSVKDNTSEICSLKIQDEHKQNWTNDPVTECDVSVLPFWIGDKTQEEQLEFFLPFATNHRTLAQLEQQGTVEGERVFTVGFPLKQGATITKRYPLVRHGIISRIEDAFDNFSNTFIIDSQAFPGSSGSPVLLDNAEMPKPIIGIVLKYIDFADDFQSEETQSFISIRFNSGLARVSPVDSIFRAIEAHLKRRIITRLLPYPP